MQIPSETQLSRAPWQTSTWTGGGQADCVEVAPIVTPTESTCDQK